MVINTKAFMIEYYFIFFKIVIIDYKWSHKEYRYKILYKI